MVGPKVSPLGRYDPEAAKAKLVKAKEAKGVKVSSSSACLCVPTGAATDTDAVATDADEAAGDAKEVSAAMAEILDRDDVESFESIGYDTDDLEEVSDHG